MNNLAIHTTTQIVTKEKILNANSSLLQLNDKYLISYHGNTLTIQNWHGQSTKMTVPSISAMKLKEYLILGTVEGKLLVYTLNGELLCAFEAHHQMITAIEMNEYYVLTGCLDGSVKVWYLDQIISHSFECVDEFIHSLKITQIQLWNHCFYISSTDKHLKIYKNKLVEDIVLDSGIVDFNVGVHGICVVLNKGEVGTFKNNVFKLIKTIEGCKHVIWKGQNVVCASTTTVYELSLLGDLILNKNVDNICGIKLLPLFKTLIGKKELPSFSKTVQPLDKHLCVDQIQSIVDSSEFVKNVLENKL